MAGDAKVSQNTWVPMAGDTKVSQNTWVPMAGDAKVSQKAWVPMAGDGRGKPGAVQTGVLTAHPESAPDGPFEG